MDDERLFACLPTPTERAERRARWRTRQLAAFDVAHQAESPPPATACPACGGDDVACSCSRTGALALTLTDTERTDR